MTQDEIVLLIFDVLSEGGVLMFLAYLYLSEKQAHAHTLRERIDDLRESAGYKANVNPELESKKHVSDSPTDASTEFTVIE